MLGNDFLNDWHVIDYGFYTGDLGLSSWIAK